MLEDVVILKFNVLQPPSKHWANGNWAPGSAQVIPQFSRKPKTWHLGQGSNFCSDHSKKTPDRGCSIFNLYMRFIMPYHGLSWLFLAHMYSLFSSFVCSCLLAICPNLQCVDTYDATITKAAFVIVNRRLKNWAVSSTHAHQTPCGSPQLASSQSTETAA